MERIPDEKLNRWLKIVGISLGACLTVFVFADYVLPILSAILSILGPILFPFVLALVLAILLDPVICFCEKRLRMKRNLAVWVVLILVLVVLGSVLGAAISKLVHEVSGFVTDLSDTSYGINVNEIFITIEEFYQTFMSGFANIDVIQNGLSNFGESLSTWGSDLLDSFSGVVRSTPITLLMLLVMAFATYYFCKDKNMVLNFLLRFIPKKHKTHAADTYASTINVFLGYIRAQLLLITITAVISFIGLSILRMDYVLMMSLVIGFFDLLPVFGPGTVYIPWILIQLSRGDYMTAIGLLIIYGVATIVRYLLQPKMISQGIGLHPLATVASIFIGLKFWGVWGLILGPIVAVILLGVYETIFANKSVDDFVTPAQSAVAGGGLAAEKPPRQKKDDKSAAKPSKNEREKPNKNEPEKSEE